MAEDPGKDKDSRKPGPPRPTAGVSRPAQGPSPAARGGSDPEKTPARPYAPPQVAKPQGKGAPAPPAAKVAPAARGGATAPRPAARKPAAPLVQKGPAATMGEPQAAPDAGLPALPTVAVQAERADFRHHPAVQAVRRLARGAGLWAVGQFVEDALRSIWRSRAWSAFAVGIIALSLATVGAFLLVADNLGGLVARMSSLEVSVYLREPAPPGSMERIRSALLAMPGVEEARFVSREQALEEFRRTSPELAAVTETLGENPFPSSLEVSLARGARSREALEPFARAVEAIDGVESVSRDLDLAERVLAASRIVKAVAAFLGGVLLLSALFTVSNVVKLTVYARRDEVEILRLVGATNAYVRGTFVTEGVLQGLGGSAIALVLLYAVFRLTGGYLRASELPLLASLATRFLSAPSMALLVASGAALGAVGSLLPLRGVARA